MRLLNINFFIFQRKGLTVYEMMVLFFLKNNIKFRMLQINFKALYGLISVFLFEYVYYKIMTRSLTKLNDSACFIRILTVVFNFCFPDLLSCVHGPSQEHDFPVWPWNLSNVW